MAQVWGGVLDGFRQRLNLPVIGIEPSSEEAKYAQERGIKTYISQIEDFKEKIELASNILCIRTLNHLLSPRYFFMWAYDQLEKGGRLVISVKNFRQICKKQGSIEKAIQIGHTYMFLPEVLERFVYAAGFDPIFIDVDENKSFNEEMKLKTQGLPTSYIKIVAKKSNRTPFADKTFQYPNVQDVFRSFSKINLLSYNLFWRIFKFKKRIEGKFKSLKK